MIFLFKQKTYNLFQNICSLTENFHRIHFLRYNISSFIGITKVISLSHTQETVLNTLILIMKEEYQRRQIIPRGNRSKRGSGDYIKPKKKEAMEINQSTTGLLDLPEEVVRKILHYFSEKDRIWKIGMTCRTLLAYSVYNVHEIEMPPGTEKATLDKLKLMLTESTFADWIRYVMLLGDQSKKLKQAAHEELPGNPNKPMVNQ